MKQLFLLYLLLVSFTANAQTNGSELYQAVQKNQTKAVEKLLTEKADPNYVLQTGPWMKVSPLITAVNNKNAEIVKMLVANGADINWKDGFKTSALMYAAATGNEEIVTYLLAQGADVNAKDEQGNSVLSAAKEGHNKKVIALIENKMINSKE